MQSDKHILGRGNHIVFLFPFLKKQKHPRQSKAVITAPTRELATQLFDALSKMTEGTEVGTRCLSVEPTKKGQ